MAVAIISVKIMPTGPDTDLAKIEHEVKKIITDFTKRTDMKVEIVPIAFGIKSVNIMFAMDEKLGGPDQLEDKILAVEGVENFEVTDVRRALG